MPVGYIRSRSRMRFTQLKHCCPWLAQSIEQCLCCFGLGRARRARSEANDSDFGQDSTIDLTDRLETLQPSHHHHHHHAEHLHYYHHSPDGLDDQFSAAENISKEMRIEEHQQQQPCHSTQPKLMDRVTSAASSNTNACRLYNNDPIVFQDSLASCSGRVSMRFKFDDDEEEEELVIVEINDDFMIEDFDDFEDFEEDDDEDDIDDDDEDIDMDIHPDDVTNYLAKTF